MVKLRIKMGTNLVKDVEVHVDDPLYILLDKLDITDKHVKFLFNRATYPIASILTFGEIGINSDCTIILINRAIAG